MPPNANSGYPPIQLRYNKQATERLSEKHYLYITVATSTVGAIDFSESLAGSFDVAGTDAVGNSSAA